MAKANKKLVGSVKSEEKVPAHATMDSPGAVDVADAATVADTDKSSMDDGDDAAVAVAEAAAESVAAAVSEVKSAPLQFGMAPNPPLQDMNRAAEKRRRERANSEYVAAQRVLARAFKRRIVS